MSNVKAAIITIGDELLIGQTIDTNSAWIAQQLNPMGIDVIRRVAVGDEKIAITSALDEELAKVQLVLITGGLGPTSDDITKPLLADYFGGKLVVNEAVLDHLKEIFTKRNRPFLEKNMKQAEVPDNCTVLFNKMGTAPGMWFDHQGKVIIAMPGVPFEMMHIMKEQALERIRKHFPGDALVHRTVFTAGEGETFIAEKIKDLEAALPAHIRLAYLPGAGMVKLRLTGRGADKAQLEAEVQLHQHAIADRLGDIVIGLQDKPLEVTIGESLLHKKATLALAESCTGGNIAHYITNVAGASQYFNGSIVCYQDEVKEQLLGVESSLLAAEGAISEKVAIEMAQGVLKLLHADYAFSVTGLLGPAGDDDKHPVGTVWMAVATKDHVTTKKFTFPYDRARNKEMAVQMGMLMIWRCINGRL